LIRLRKDPIPSAIDGGGFAEKSIRESDGAACWEGKEERVGEERFT